MKKLIFLLLLLLIATPVFAQQQEARMSLGVVGGGVPVAGGPNAWFYCATATPKVEPTWDDTFILPTTYVECCSITLEAGNLTKFGLRCGETYDEHTKLALYDAGGNQLTDAVIVGPYVDGAWIEASLGAPYAVSATTYYICELSDTASIVKSLTTGLRYYDSDCGATCTYAGFPYATLTYEGGGIPPGLAFGVFVQ